MKKTRKKKQVCGAACFMAAEIKFSKDVRPSVHHTFLTMFLSSYHPEIFRSYYHWQTWCPCKRSRSQVMTPFSRFRTVTPVWIHILRWNDAQSLMLLRIGALFFFKVIHQISRSHGTKKSLILTQIGHFQTVTPVWIHQWLWNDAQSLNQHRRVALLFFKVFRQFSRSCGTKNRQFWPKLGVSEL